jgi:hypothetical protein
MLGHLHTDYGKSRKMNPTSRLLIFMALSLLLAIAIPMIVTAATI